MTGDERSLGRDLTPDELGARPSSPFVLHLACPRHQGDDLSFAALPPPIPSASQPSTEMQAFYPYIAGLYPRRPLGEVLPTELFRVHDARDLIDRSLPGQEARYSMAEQQFASLPLGERITAAKNHAGPRRFYQPHLSESPTRSFGSDLGN